MPVTTTSTPIPGQKVIGYDGQGNPIYSSGGTTTQSGQGVSPVGSTQPPPSAPPVIQPGFPTTQAAAAPAATPAATPVSSPGAQGRTDQAWKATSSALHGVPLVGGALDAVFGSGGSASTYDAKGELAKSEAAAGQVYGKSQIQADQIAKYGAPKSTITAQQIAAPGNISAQTIGTPDILGGADAATLRQQQLTQAATAANSPSSAAAQMRAAGGQIQSQQAGMAAMARGADRGAARRDALLATGTQGMQAANSTAALAAQEQAAKQQAYTAALSGVRSGDVGVSQAQTQIGAQNQGADLTAQQATAGNYLQAVTANQGADLAASKATADNNLQGWTAQQAAQNSANLTSLQGVGAQNQAQGTAATYGSNADAAAAKKQAGIIGAVGGVIGALSDENAKTDISTIGDSAASRYGSILSKAYGTEGESSPYGVDSSPRGQDFLKWQAPAPAQDKDSGGGILGAILSDERTKREVDAMSTDDIAQFTRDNPLVTFRYNPDAPGTDGGAAYKAGTLAQGVEDAGPLGRMFVSERPDGLKQVEYGPMAHAEAKGAQATADKALELAAAAYTGALKKPRTGKEAR
jgi:hypothetical protein